MSVAPVDYIAHWETLSGNDVQARFLAMLKERAWTHKDRRALDALRELTARWIAEPFQPNE